MAVGDACLPVTVLQECDDGLQGDLAGGEGAHDHEAALEVLHAVRVVGADAAAGEKVDDALFKDVGGLGCFA